MGSISKDRLGSMRIPELPSSADDVGKVPACEKLRWVKDVGGHGGAYMACGNCNSCRSRRSKEVKHRIMLEAGEWPCDNMAFVCLTYSDPNIPGPKTRDKWVAKEQRKEGWKAARLKMLREHGADYLREKTPKRRDYKPPEGSLWPRDIALFLMRLRKLHGRFRYYVCGEYSRNMRPHYHLILFGYPPCERNATKHGSDGVSATCCEPCRRLTDIWGLGRVQSEAPRDMAHVGRYCSAYLTKNSRLDRDWLREQGYLPEFQLWSRKPVLGSAILHEVASTILEYNLYANTDVPPTLVHGRKELPLPRHYRIQLRKLLGRDEKAPPKVVADFVANRRAVELLARGFGSSLPEMSEKHHAIKEHKRKIFAKARS